MKLSDVSLLSATTMVGSRSCTSTRPVGGGGLGAVVDVVVVEDVVGAVTSAVVGAGATEGWVVGDPGVS